MYLFIIYICVSMGMTLIYSHSKKGGWLFEMASDMVVYSVSILAKYGLVPYSLKSKTTAFAFGAVGCLVMAVIILLFPFLLIYLYWANR